MSELFNIEKSGEYVHFTFQGITYRINPGALDIFQQQEATRIMSAAMTDGDFDLGKPEASDAVNHIIGMTLVKQGDEFKPMNGENFGKVFSNDFAKEFQKEQKENLVDHMNTAALFLFRLIRDEEWRPEAEDSEKKSKTSAES